MTTEVGAGRVARYIACYVIWASLFALIGYVLFQIVGLSLDISLALGLNPWVARAMRQLPLPVLGIIWLVAIFWLEHDLRTAVARGQLLRRTLRALIPVLVVWGLVELISFLV
jgi:hypothetical protein